MYSIFLMFSVSINYGGTMQQAINYSKQTKMVSTFSVKHFGFGFIQKKDRKTLTCHKLLKLLSKTSSYDFLKELLQELCKEHLYIHHIQNSQIRL